MTASPDTAAPPRAPARRTLSRDDWIQAAARLLETRGIANVKIDRLARQLKVTRGSFYFHFKGLKDILGCLMEQWRQRNCAPFQALVGRTDLEGRALFDAATDIWVKEDPFRPALDMAVRDWGRAARPVMDEVQAMDTLRIGLLTRAFEAMGYPPDESLIRARVTYFHQIGYYALSFKEPRHVRRRYSPIYWRVLTGLRPEGE